MAGLWLPRHVLVGQAVLPKYGGGNERVQIFRDTESGSLVEDRSDTDASVHYAAPTSDPQEAEYLEQAATTTRSHDNLVEKLMEVEERLEYMSKGRKSFTV